MPLRRWWARLLQRRQGTWPTPNLKDRWRRTLNCWWNCFPCNLRKEYVNNQVKITTWFEEISIEKSWKKHDHHMGGNLLTLQSLILMSYFLYFWAPFLATFRFAMPKLATISENIWVPHGLIASVWTLSTFYIALFSEKLCPVAFLTK